MKHRIFTFVLLTFWGISISAQTQLVGWNFENATKRALITNDASFQSAPYTADLGITGNINSQIIETGGRPLFSGWVNGSGGTGTNAVNSNTWQDGNGSKYWQISLVSTGYSGLTLSSKQYGSSTGPKDFKIQYSLNEADWFDVSGGTVTVATNWTSGVVNNLSLPVDCEDQATLFIRWLMNSNTSVNNSIVASTGTNRIDDISISGSTSAVPQLSVSESLLTGFTYIVGNGPSAEQSFNVTGSNLTASVLINAPADYEIAETLGTWLASLTLYPSLGELNDTVYVRLKQGLAAGSYNSEQISLLSSGAESKFVSCSGTVTSPTLFVSVSSLNGFTYMQGLGPSPEQDFSVSGSNLTGDLTVSAPADYEISLTAETGFTNSLMLVPTSNSVPLTQIFVRLKAGLTIGSFNSEEIVISSAGASNEILTCSGSVTAGMAPTAPVAIAASAVAPTSFLANWNASDNATSYALDVYSGSAQLATDLIISEYVEGSSSNKYIEIFNGTPDAIDLANYNLQLYSNGSATPTNNTALSGILASGNCVVYKNSSAVLTLPDGVTATSNTAVNFNGDDAVALINNVSGLFVDIIGSIGYDPGTQWGTSPLWTINTTLVRKSSVTSGITTNPPTSFPSIATEWDYYAQDTATYLGSHTMGNRAIVYVDGYENLNVGNVTSYPVTGLDESTDYHYLVRATNIHGTSTNSNVIDVTTSSSTAPLINVSGSFGSFATDEGTPSATQSYTLSGSNLTSAINISIPTGFELSTNGGGSYASTFTSVIAGFSGSVLLRLAGTAAGTYSGNIVHSSTGASDVNIYATGVVTGASISVPTIQATNITGYPAPTTISLEWTPGNGAYRIVKINTINSFTVPTDGSSPSASSGYSGSGEQVIYNGATEYIEGSPYNGCTVTNLVPNTVYWFRVYDYNGTGVDTRYLASSATNNPRSVTTLNSSGSGYYSSIYGYGTTLKGLLHTLIKTTHTTQYSYTALTTQLPYTDEDPSNPNNLIEIYTGWSVPKGDFGAGVTDWNREHTWSKSHGDFGDVAPAGTDLHHLRPCDATVNSRKSNRDFDDGGDLYTDNSPPSGYTGNTGCYDTANSWEPRTADKGDVARMIMYMAVRYEGDDSNFSVDLELVDHVYSDEGTYQPYYGKLATLLQWHVQDPPDARELQRNNRIAERQGNRNPFIDMPGYAARVWTPCPLYNSNISTTAFTGNWSTPIIATDYYLQVATDSLFTALVSGYENLDIDLVTSRSISGLNPGGTYYYRLRSFFTDDYSMYSPYLSVTLTAPITATATITPAQALEEINLAGAALSFKLFDTTFTDSTLSLANFTLSNAPSGLSIQSVSYVNTTTATIILSYTGADFDSNYGNFRITVADAEVQVNYNITSAAISIAAHVEGVSQIDVLSGQIVLSATAIPNAISYRIFSADTPTGTYTECTSQGEFDLVTPNIWRISATLHLRRFYRVSALIN